MTRIFLTNSAHSNNTSVRSPSRGTVGLVFTDGTKLCASPDRNGLRPSRYKITDDDILLYIGSEAGAVIFDDATIVRKGRLGPGQMISANTATGEFKCDRQIKEELAQQKPYRRWIDENRVELRKFVSPAAHVPEIDFSPLDLSRQQVVHDISLEELDMVFPPIDPIREWAVMSLGVGLGPERNLLVETPKHYNTVSLTARSCSNTSWKRSKTSTSRGFPLS
jgi:glutamate synthase (NADPH/NADH) large chain/glutamate synthase (ferredoxin)